MPRTELAFAYENACYRFHAGSRTIRFKTAHTCEYIRHLLRHDCAAGALFITAWNPYGVTKNAADNNRANEALLARLTTLNLRVLTGDGASPDNVWHEDSFLAYPVTTEQALALCRRYNQNAVVFIDSSGMARLLWNPALSW